TFVQCWIWCGSETERLTDRLADDLGIGADASEPAACLARTGGGAAAHRSDHRLQLVHGANAAFDLGELAAHGAAAFCSRPTASLLARSRTAEARATRVASSSVPVLAIAATLAPAFASRCAATRFRTSAMTFTGRESKAPSARAASSATWS